MARRDDPPRPRRDEPTPVTDIFVTAIGVNGTDEYTRITGWISHRQPNQAEDAERRIVTRLVMPPSVARDLAKRLRRSLPKGDGG